MMRTGILSAIAFSAIVLNPVVAGAAPPPAATAPMQLPYQSANLPTSGPVQAFYAGYSYSPIWFSGNALKPEAMARVQILQRSPLDGLANGQQYAAAAQSAAPWP